eukprot:CAMPEP_0183559146 /NCGR_PEP_ID=MMETSP0371-20130417/90841_1 /TAXON_ID=268820 /ORGANISM="Peridinium aciculiferum, Strain PAER-2" /LENGTH=85 /DNA_ID=CAMNT_0025766849 /DNA_START=192 /DNA_END=450 /DNA_ORIENTATION=+
MQYPAGEHLVDQLGSVLTVGPSDQVADEQLISAEYFLNVVIPSATAEDGINATTSKPAIGALRATQTMPNPAGVELRGAMSTMNS